MNPDFQQSGACVLPSAPWSKPMATLERESAASLSGGPQAHRLLKDKYPHFLGAVTETQAGEVGSWGPHSKRVVPSQGSSVIAMLFTMKVPFMPQLALPLCSLPPFFLPPLQGSVQGGSAEPLTSLVLSPPLQKSCTCHPGRPAYPAASAHSTPWLS